MTTTIAPAQTERDERRERVVKAAVEWVYDQSCSNALMELEDAVTEFMRVPLHAARRALSEQEKGE